MDARDSRFALAPRSCFPLPRRAPYQLQSISTTPKKGALCVSIVDNPLPDKAQNAVDGVVAYVGELRNLDGFQDRGEELHERSKFGHG
jgi:hypothetical protein